MCGRYYIDDDTAGQIEKIVRQAGTGADISVGEIRPTDRAVVLCERKRIVGAVKMNWGFPKFDKKGVIIHARCETALDKRMFRESMLHRRCVIPAAGFYEWGPDKNKTAFCPWEEKGLYMAGIWRPYENVESFVILTTTANASVEPVHDRMPLLLEKEEVKPWILDDTFLDYALHKNMPPLKTVREYEQQTLRF